MAGIFVSYRRIDSSGSAGRLFDRLKDRFGREAVFMDVEGGIPRGGDFGAAIARALESADALVVVIGPRWLACTDAAGRRRLDHADVRDISVNSVNLNDGTGSPVPAAMYHLKEGYDENNDGKDDLKLDYRVADLKSSANKLFASSTFRLTGRLKDEKGGRPIRGERSVAVVQ